MCQCNLDFEPAWRYGLLIRCKDSKKGLLHPQNKKKPTFLTSSSRHVIVHCSFGARLLGIKVRGTQKRGTSNFDTNINVQSCHATQNGNCDMAKSDSIEVDSGFRQLQSTRCKGKKLLRFSKYIRLESSGIRYRETLPGEHCHVWCHKTVRKEEDRQT